MLVAAAGAGSGRLGCCRGPTDGCCFVHRCGRGRLRFMHHGGARGQRKGSRGGEKKNEFGHSLIHFAHKFGASGAGRCISGEYFFKSAIRTSRLSSFEA